MLLAIPLVLMEASAFLGSSSSSSAVGRSFISSALPMSPSNSHQQYNHHDVEDTMRKLAEQHISLEIRRNHKQSKEQQQNSSDPSYFSIDQAESAHGMPWTETIGLTDQMDPLLYMPFWEWQMKHMKENLTNLQPCDSVSKFSYKENTDKKARIVSHCYKSDEYRKIRMTYYDAGDNTQVFNSVWYPDPKYNLPVLGIDLLAFNRKKYLAIVDFQPLHENEDDHDVLYEHRMKPIKEQYDTLKGRMSSKFYDETQFFSQQMLFSRFEDENIVSRDLFPAFKRYVNLHNKLIREAEADEEQVEFVLDRHKAYDTYSAERDPATGLFAAMFGKDWAEDFVYDFLFSTSERHPNGLQIPVMGPPPGVGGTAAGGASAASSSSSTPQKQKQVA
jgi:15,16-dihydrobiliverdin:ferredoxin oxidoreductase